MTITAWAELQESKKKADILRQLQGLGYEITQRTFYRHCAQGKCRPGKNGVYTRRLVKSYVVSEGFPRYREESEDEAEAPSSALSVEKQRLENEKLRLHCENAALQNRKNAGLLVERELLHLELAARVVALDNGFCQKIELEAPLLISTVLGDNSRQPEFINLLRSIWNELLNGYATTDEFEVLFEVEKEKSMDDGEHQNL